MCDALLEPAVAASMFDALDVPPVPRPAGAIANGPPMPPLVLGTPPLGVGWVAVGGIIVLGWTGLLLHADHDRHPRRIADLSLATFMACVWTVAQHPRGRDDAP
jgi:hypothetical protein